MTTMQRMFIVAAGITFTLNAHAADNAPTSKRTVAELIRALKSEEVDQREHAAQALGLLGPAAADATTALGAALNDDMPYVRTRSAEALEKIGPAAIPALTEALNNPNDDIRATAASALGQFGAQANSAIPALINALHDSASPVRARATHSLEQIGPAAVEPLLHLVEVRHDGSRALALQALGGIHSDNETLVPRLLKVLEDADEQIRMTAAKTLARQGSAHTADLIQGLKSENASVRAQVADVLAEVGRHGTAAIPVLMTLLEDSAPNVRASAAHALGQMGSEAAKTAVAPLQKLLKDSDPAVVSRATEALTNLTAFAKPKEEASAPEIKPEPSANEMTASPVKVKPAPKPKSKPPHKKVPAKKPKKTLSAAELVKLLQSPDEAVRNGAVTALVQMNANAVPALTQGLQDGTTTVRQTIALAFVQVDSTAAVQAFQDAAKQGNLGVRLDAIQALQTLGPAAKNAAPVLIELLKDPIPAVQSASEAALTSIGTDEAKKALEAYRKQQLEKTISGLVNDLRQEGKKSSDAEVALVKLGAPVIKPVAQVLSWPQVPGRRAAARVLNRLGKLAAPAAPALINALDDADKEVRAQAAEALSKLNTPEAQKALRFFPIMEKIRSLLSYFKR